MAYKILLNGSPSVTNIANGDVHDPWGRAAYPREYAFSTGRKAQAALKAHKKYCVDNEISLEGCFYTIEKGEFVPFEETI